MALYSSHDDNKQESNRLGKLTLTISELRNRVLIGPLPADFLRLTQSSNEQPFQRPYDIQEQRNSIPGKYESQEQAFIPVNSVDHFYAFIPPHTRGRITIKIVEAKLTKNYGITRMDPYCRVRVGNIIFETPTSVNGGKTPSWNRTVNAYLPNEVESIYLQLFDERSFMDDCYIAWAHIILPEGIFSGEVIDEWYPLSGSQGEGKEGIINLIMSFSPLGTLVPLPNVQQQHQAHIQQQIFESSSAAELPQLTTEELAEINLMIPSVDGDVIRSVYEEKRGDKCATVNALLEMTHL